MVVHFTGLFDERGDFGGEDFASDSGRVDVHHGFAPLLAYCIEWRRNKMR